MTSLSLSPSSKPLAQKLGITEGKVVVALKAPEGYRGLLGALPEGVVLSQRARKGADVVHYFSESPTDLRGRFPSLKDLLKPGGAIWISWPKGSSRVASGLDDNKVRSIGLENDMVDVKVCSVDERWSGLKFVRRKRTGLAGNGFKPGEIESPGF